MARSIASADRQTAARCWRFSGRFIPRRSIPSSTYSAKLRSFPQMKPSTSAASSLSDRPSTGCSAASSLAMS